jgi:hypothetical protein
MRAASRPPTRTAAASTCRTETRRQSRQAIACARIGTRPATPCCSSRLRFVPVRPRCGSSRPRFVRGSSSSSRVRLADLADEGGQRRGDVAEAVTHCEDRCRLRHLEPTLARGDAARRATLRATTLPGTDPLRRLDEDMLELGIEAIRRVVRRHQVLERSENGNREVRESCRIARCPVGRVAVPQPSSRTATTPSAGSSFSSATASITRATDGRCKRELS